MTECEAQAAVVISNDGNFRGLLTRQHLLQAGSQHISGDPRFALGGDSSQRAHRESPKCWDTVEAVFGLVPDCQWVRSRRRGGHRFVQQGRFALGNSSGSALHSLPPAALFEASVLSKSQACKPIKLRACRLAEFSWKTARMPPYWWTRISDLGVASGQCSCSSGWRVVVSLTR